MIMTERNNEPDAAPKPAWVRALMTLLRVWLYMYDLLTYIPIMLFVQPRHRVARSERTKAVRLTDTNVWRAVGEPQRNSLINEIYRSGQRVDSVFAAAVMMYGARPCMGARKVLGVEYEVQKDGRKFEKLSLGDYEWLTYAEVDERVLSIATGLRAVGHASGRSLCIYAETRQEWMMMALACFKSNIPVVTVYATLGEDAITHAIDDTQSITLVTTQELLPVVAKMVHTCATLERVIYFESANPDAQDALQSLPDGDRVALMSLTQMRDEGEGGGEDGVDVCARTYHSPSDPPKPSGTPRDTALIMYTSGTTGTPKGVIVTHENLIAANSCQVAVIPEMGQRDDDIFCAYLPLAHILEVDCELACIFNGVAIGYSSAMTMTDRSSKIRRNAKGDCSVLRPTLLPTVPAIMDRIYKNISEEMRQAGPFARALIDVCIERRRARIISGYDDPFLNRLIFARIRRILGGSVRAMLCGGAPLNADTQRFISICFCCPVLQGYGLTETCGAGTLCDAEDLDVGSVGAPLMCNRIMLREWTEGGYSPKDDPPSGEILISGPNVSTGYWRQPEKTREEFFELDGVRWFATGDIGKVRPDGSFKIVDRKKDLVKLSHGEYVSLGKVETALLTHPLADNVCVYADSEQASTVALVVPNDVQLRKLAKEAGINETDWSKLCSNSKLAAQVCKLLTEHGIKNSKLNRIELPSRVHLCADVWTPASGLLTEALKLKRRPIAEKYAQAIKQLYE